MLVAHSFDLWQRDSFFSAAEEVQHSADIMESAYRTWEREKREGLKPEYLDELCRELQTAFGTAKWQLEEFEKAVRLSYRSRADDVTMGRHKQFVEAIENQISRVETDLRETFSKQGKEPLRWVNLDEEECDDLAAFLSGSSRNVGDTCPNSGASTNGFLEKNNCTRKERGSSIKAASNREISYHIKPTEFCETRGNVECQADRTSGSRTTWSSPDRGDWKIVIDNEEDENNDLAPCTEATPKDKGSKPVFWRQSSRDRLEARSGMLSCSQLRGTRWINQIWGRVGGCRRQLQAPLPLKLNSVKFKLALLLTIFLVVPFVLYSA